jgi:hypothetical protein
MKNIQEFLAQYKQKGKIFAYPGLRCKLRNKQEIYLHMVAPHHCGYLHPLFTNQSYHLSIEGKHSLYGRREQFDIIEIYDKNTLLATNEAL